MSLFDYCETSELNTERKVNTCRKAMRRWERVLFHFRSVLVEEGTEGTPTITVKGHCNNGTSLCRIEDHVVLLVVHFVFL